MVFSRGGRVCGWEVRADGKSLHPDFVGVNLMGFLPQIAQISADEYQSDNDGNAGDAG